METGCLSASAADRAPVAGCKTKGGGVRALALGPLGSLRS